MARKKIISRDEAKASGLKHYFTNEPCKRGHISERLVSNWVCIACFNEREKANRHKTRARLKRWRDKNREYVRVRDNEYRAENPDAARARYKRWANSERGYLVAMASRHRSRFRKNGNGGEITGDELLEVLQGQNHLCVYCSVELTNDSMHLDHIMPAKLGGRNVKENVQFLCKKCSKAKGHLHPDEFMKGLENG